MTEETTEKKGQSLVASILSRLWPARRRRLDIREARSLVTEYLDEDFHYIMCARATYVREKVVKFDGTVVSERLTRLRE